MTLKVDFRPPYIYTHIDMNTYLQIHTHTYTYCCKCIHTRTYTHIHMNTHLQMHTRTAANAYTPAHTHTYTWTHTCRCMHTHTHTCTYTHLLIHMQKKGFYWQEQGETKAEETQCFLLENSCGWFQKQQRYKPWYLTRWLTETELPPISPRVVQNCLVLQVLLCLQ